MAGFGLQIRAERRAEELASGRFETLGRACAFPLVLWLGGQRLRLADRADLMDFLMSLRAALRAEGVVGVSVRVVAEGLPRAGRMRVWKEWTGHTPCGRTRPLAATVSRMRLEGADAVTEAVEFTWLDLGVRQAA